MTERGSVGLELSPQPKRASEKQEAMSVRFMVIPGLASVEQRRVLVCDVPSRRAEPSPR